MARLFAIVLFCAGIFCIAHGNAQVPMTGAGLPKPAGAAGYTGPGDCSGCLTTYSVWYGLSAFSAATAGTKAAHVCNASSVCADINTLTNGKFDVATAQAGTTNCGGAGGQCTITTMYDKSGNGNDCAVSNTVNLTFNALGSFPSLNFGTGSKGFCQTGSNVNATTPSTMVEVFSFTSGDSFSTPLFVEVFGPGFGINNGATAIGIIDSTGNIVIGATASTNTFYAVGGVWNTTTSALYLNGVSTTGTTAASPSNEPARFGDGSWSGQAFEAGIQAGVAANSTQEAAYSANRRAFYGN